MCEHKVRNSYYTSGGVLYDLFDDLWSRFTPLICSTNNCQPRAVIRFFFCVQFKLKPQTNFTSECKYPALMLYNYCFINVLLPLNKKPVVFQPPPPRLEVWRVQVALRTHHQKLLKLEFIAFHST